MDRWTDKKDVAHISCGVLLSQEKSEIVPSATTWVHREISYRMKSETERQVLYDNAYLWNLKYDTEELL